MINLRELHNLTKDNESTVNILLSNELIPETVICHKCGNIMNIQKGEKLK